MSEFDYQVSLDGKRAVQVNPFGIACYEGETEDDVFHGSHTGVVGTEDEAKVWLAGGMPAKMIRIYSGASP